MALTQVKTSGIADDAVTEAKVANDAISTTEMKAGTDGHIITYDASGNPTTVGPGSDGQVLTSTGAGSPPAFEAIALANDAVTTAKIADDAITSALIADDAVVTAAIADDAITSALIADDAVVAAAIADDAVVQAAIADAAVDEARLQISNSPTNGYFLQAQSGNTGGLTWAESSGAQMGKIVCNTTTSAANSSSNSSLADTNLSASMTPTAASSKIWVQINQHVVVQEGTATYDGGNPDNRASIAINAYWTKDGGSNWTQEVNGGNDAGGAWSFGLDMRHEVGNGLSRIKGFVCHSFLIDHDTTNEVTVKTQFKCGLANMNVTCQGGGRSSITLIEVLNP